MTKNEMAHLAMKELQDTAYGLDTSTIRKRIGVSVADQADLRFVLNRLETLKKVQKMGGGTFRWKLLVDSWDEHRPFDEATTIKDATKDVLAKKKIQYSNQSDIPGSEPEDDMAFTLPKYPPAQAKGVNGMSSENKVIAEAMIILEKKVDGIDDRQTAVESKMTEMQTLLEKAQEISKRSVATLKVEKYDGKTIVLKNKVLPKVYNKVLDLVRCRRNVMLVGPAGCGKTYLAKLVADSLGLDFGSLSCTSGMSENHLLGRGVPDLTHGKNRFQGTEFLTLYENGGLFLLDEFDAADPNLLLAVNTALANGYCNVPNRTDKPKAIRHKDNAIVATANTFGRGANRVYAGRNQLDEATLDRFRVGVVEVDYDEVVEAALCPDDELREKLQAIRTKIQATGLRRVMSSRFMEDAYVMRKEANWSIPDIVSTFLQGWTPEEMAKVVSA